MNKNIQTLFVLMTLAYIVMMVLTGKLLLDKIDETKKNIEKINKEFQLSSKMINDVHKVITDADCEYIEE